MNRLVAAVMVGNARGDRRRDRLRRCAARGWHGPRSRSRRRRSASAGARTVPGAVRLGTRADPPDAPERARALDPARAPALPRRDRRAAGASARLRLRPDGGVRCAPRRSRGGRGRTPSRGRGRGRRARSGARRSRCRPSWRSRPSSSDRRGPRRGCARGSTRRSPARGSRGAGSRTPPRPSARACRPRAAARGRRAANSRSSSSPAAWPRVSL